MVEREATNSSRAPQPAGGYAQAIKVRGAQEVLYISGQIPVRQDGTLPDTFAGQARQAWANVAAQIDDAGMSLDDLVKVTIFLSDRSHAVENRAIRQEFLGTRQIALTVIITGIFDSAWLLEIEAVAAK